MKFKMSNDCYIYELALGRGTLKYYNYFANGIKLTTKSAVYEAIKLKISNITRKDLIDNSMETFNHKTLSFEKVYKRCGCCFTQTEECVGECRNINCVNNKSGKGDDV